MIRFGFVVEQKGDTPGLVRQVHGADVVTIENAAHADRLAASPPHADGVVTWQKGITLPIFTADCVPVLLHATIGPGPIAAVHAGWRGTRSGIVAAAIRAIKLPPSQITAILGPSILCCCFEVKEDFVAAFREAGRPIEPYLEVRGRRLFWNLTRFVVDQELAGIGVIDAKFSRCTYCSNPPLPSYRRNGNTEMRLRSWIRREA